MDAALTTVLTLLDNPAALDAAERDVARLVGRPLANDPCEPTPEIAGVLALLDTAQLATEVAVEVALARLVVATVPGGLLDPTRPGTELPWLRLVERLRDRPQLARIAARRWYRHLHATCMDSEAGIPGAPWVLAAYVAACCAARAGRIPEARRALLVAQVEAEADEAGPAELGTIVRAVRIVVGDGAREGVDSCQKMSDMPWD